MAETFRLEVITPERVFYEGDVELLMLKTLDGYEGYMANHNWQVKLLDTGEMKIRLPGKKYLLAATTGGYIDVAEKILVYVDAAEWPEEIDVERALRSKANAEQILKNQSHQSIVEIQSAKISILKAINRINVKNAHF